MIEKLAIANRGEIAIRIIRAARILGIKTLALYSERDADSLHVRLADEAASLGSGGVNETYLNIDKIIEIMQAMGVDAVHPGYGFLSENAEFAQRVVDNHFVFIGPSPGVLRLLGDKVQAIRMAKDAGLPTVPGSDEYVNDLDHALDLAEEIGFPLIIKAVYGGGGKGMELVRSIEEMEASFESCQEMARSYFGRGEVFIEKFIDSPRHIEVQVLADHHKNVLHLGDRECSIQRSHQKLLEEAPSFLDDETRNTLGRKVTFFARQLSYRNAGTTEFLWKDGVLYFNEVNPRIQVEHPVSEMITGIDIVVEQLRIAMGEELPYSQEDIQFKGHAIEYRINAEDPLGGFFPQTGRITRLHIPTEPETRFDTFLYPGYEIRGDYDSLIGKLIVWGRTREEAIIRSETALKELQIAGLKTNHTLFPLILKDPAFKSRNLSTSFIAERKILEKLADYERKVVAAFYMVASQQMDSSMLVSSVPSSKSSKQLLISTDNQWKQKGRWEMTR